MTRDLKKRTGARDPRRQMSLDDYRKLSEEADAYGIFRFVLTGGEALLDKNLDQLIYALDPEKHLIILDTNGWTFDEDKAKEISNDLQHCKQLAKDNTSVMGNISFWLLSPTAQTQYEDIYRKCMINRGHSVLN